MICHLLTQVKSKSRSKSPRSRSPPPTTSRTSGDVTNQDIKSSQHDSWSLRKFNADLLAQHPPDEGGGGGSGIHDMVS